MADDQGLPDFIDRPARFARALSSDAQRAVIEGMSGGVGSSGLPYFANATAALGWYQNHFTDLGVLAHRIQALDKGSPGERYRNVRAAVVAARVNGGVDAHREDVRSTRREVPLGHVYVPAQGHPGGHPAYAFTGDVVEQRLAAELFVALSAQRLGGADKARAALEEAEPHLDDMLAEVVELVERVHRCQPVDAFAEGLKRAHESLAEIGTPDVGYSTRFRYSSPNGETYIIILTRTETGWLVEHGVPF